MSNIVQFGKVNKSTTGDYPDGRTREEQENYLLEKLERISGRTPRSIREAKDAAHFKAKDRL